MASKKCPKCGEDNPAEAVMCWACYTPLSGGPVMAGGAPIGGPATAGIGAKGPGPVGVPGGDEAPAKKGVDPKMIGVGAFLVVGALVAFMVNGGMGGGSTDDGTGVDPTAPAPGPGGQPAPPPPPPTTNVPPPTGGGGGGTAAPAPVALPFQTVVPPNPQYATGTMGILVNKPGMTAVEAAGFAKFAKNQYSRNGKWKNMQICVFADQQTANAFKSYQSKRRGSPLTNDDYQQLGSRGIWGGTPAFLESKGNKELVYYPSRNPNGWWSSRR